MHQRRLAALSLLAATLFAACAAKDDTAARQAQLETQGRYREGFVADKLDDTTPRTETAAAPSDQPNRPVRGGIDGAPVDNRKIVRTGHIDLVVKTYDDTRDQIDAIVKAAGGFIDSTRVSRSEGQVSSAVIVVRIPASGFGDLLPKLRALGDIQQESTDAADITAEYVDTSARLSSARALEKRLIELAATRTGTVAEVLEVERELARVRGEIEQLEGQMRVWNDQVSLSTLTITLATKSPEIAAVAEPGFDQRVSRAWHDSIAAMRTAAQGLSIALIALLPWLPLLLPALFFGIRALRRRIRLPRAVVYMPASYPMAPPPPPPASGPQGQRSS
ncbi:MAG TPA: DUF4349 domain-containing protein [Kofleriaceae bacterium]|nr:DUF4349 domain-containing protein [Kofleriaceae bacterium]